VETARKKSTNDMKKGIYEKLKNNMNKVNLDAVLSDDLRYESYTKAESIESSKNNLNRIVEKIEKIENCKSEYYCILGIELANY